METWTQVYDPLGALWLSALVAALPIVFFFVTLAVFRWEAYLAGLGTIVVTLVIAIVVYGMPVGLAARATAMGMAYGLWPISWIILSAVFLYKLSVKSGQFEVIRASVVTITEDQRLQVILIGFAFGAFLEGAAGFGAPVAITAAILATLGLNPLYAAGLCLIANTAPVAFGALGIPILVAGKTAGIDPFLIGKMAGRQLPLLSLFVPFFIVWLMDGFKGVRQTWPAVLVAGGSFAVTQYLHLQLHRAGAARHHLRAGVPGGNDRLSQVLASEASLRVRFGWRCRRTSGCDAGEAIELHHRADPQGVVAVHHPDGGRGDLDASRIPGAVRRGRSLVRHDA